MKRLFLFVLIITGSQQSYSQVRKGNFLAGGSLSFQSSKYSAGGNNIGTFNFMPDAGYFFYDRFVAGLRASFTNYSDEGNSYRDLLAGPFARYYFLPVAQKTNIFLEGNFMLGSEKYRGYDPESKTQLAVVGGSAFFLNPHVAVEATLGWRSLKHKNDAGRYNSFGIGIGFQIHLDCTKEKK
jgi:Outer membrane protein beta-barrel domain